MGFEELASELHKSAEAESKKIVHASENEAKKIVKKAHNDSQAVLQQAKKNAAEFVKQESSEKLTSAKLSAKKIVDEAKSDAVEASLKQVWQAFRKNALVRETYPVILSRLIESGLSELKSQQATVYVRDQDKELVQGFATKSLAKQYSGGAIIESEDGKVRVNKTLEEIFSQKKPELRKQAYDKLF